MGPIPQAAPTSSPLAVELGAPAVEPVETKGRPPKPPRRPTSPDGIIVVDKPQGITSHDVVARLRRLCGTRAVGHGGTLDPMATGVLICGIGKGTKLLTYVSGSDKAYTATIRLGIATTTDDAEGQITSAPGARYPDHSCDPAAPERGAQDLNRESILTAIDSLTGEIEQVPTKVSAIKVNGKRAYDLVREGEEVELKARPVTVSEFTVTDIVNAEQDGVPVVDLLVNVVVSSGTYVRALARDLGEALGVGGHLTMLRRTRIGKVGLDRAQTLKQLEELADTLRTGTLRSCDCAQDDGERAQNDVGGGEPLPTMPLGEASGLFMPTRLISDDEARDLSQGKFIAKGETDSTTAALTDSGKLVAIIEPFNQTRAKPKVVFPWEP